MERIITLSQFKKAVTDVYEDLKGVSEGQVDQLLADENIDTSKFGIAVATTSGVVFNVGDTDVAAPMGALAKLPIASILLMQNSFKELMQKAGQCPCSAGKKVKPGVKGSKGIRAVSAIEPVGDPDSKWNFIENRMIDLIGESPVLDDKLYEKRKAMAVADNDVNRLAEADFYLYDDAAESIDLYRRAQSMSATATQMAMMGATIANDGVNPLTGNVVYDPAVSRRIIGMMAAKGPHKMALPWSVAAGVPARSSFGGMILAVYPGVFAIAAYSPLTMPNGVSIKAAQAIVKTMNALGINLYAADRVVIAVEK